MLTMSAMDKLEQDLMCCLFCIDCVQGKEEKKLSELIGTNTDHDVEDECCEAKLTCVRGCYALGVDVVAYYFQH